MLCHAVLALAAPCIQIDVAVHPRIELRAAVAENLNEALIQAPADGVLDPIRELGRLKRLGEAAASELGQGRPAALLRAAVLDARWQAVLDERTAVASLQASLGELASDLAFEPLIEAELPEGFPPPTPVQAIERKHYPAYRLASTPMGGRSNGAFWSLFQHIQENEIAMTAPVETTYSEQMGTRPREERMAFLYATPSLGSPGTDGLVEVIDVAALEVVSLGLRGRMSVGRVADARADLEAWLAEHPDLEVAGPLRTFGYNSPMVPSARQLFEVQLPVRVRRAY